MWNNKARANAIRQLIINLGDVAKTQEQTGIPERTLERWKQELKTQGAVIYWENDGNQRRLINRYEKMRDDMIFQIQNFLNQMAYMPPKAAADFANAVARLTDRLYKIEHIIQFSGQFEIRVSLDKFTISEEAEGEEIVSLSEEKLPPPSEDSALP